jgi:hypothetical protein
MGTEIEIIRGLDLTCRGAVRKLTQRVVTIEKKMKIIVRFVLRRAKEVNNRLYDLEDVANHHSKGMSSLGRSMKLISTLFKIMGARIDKVCEDLGSSNDNYSDIWDDLRIAERKIDALEKLHSTKIDGAAYFQPPPSMEVFEKEMSETKKPGEVKKF